MNSSFLPFYLLGLRCNLFRPCLLDLSCKCAKRAPSGGQVPHDAWSYRSCKICPRLNAINVFGELKLIILLAVLARTDIHPAHTKNLCRHATQIHFTRIRLSCQSFFADLSLIFPENQSGILTSESERCGHGDIHLLFSANPGNKVKILLRFIQI